jgi:uncharacterized protein with FMN-binding domain
MKRALLIAGGTVGGLGAVLSITPPQFGSSSGVAGGISTSTNTGTTASTPAPAPAATQEAAATPAATKKATTTATKKATAAATKAASTGVSGTFVGSTSQTRFGPVQVEVTISNGKITSAKALQYPNNDFRSQSISQQAIPYLIQETLAANSSNIQGVGGASYTSQGWYDSLVSALAKAGMK